MVKTLAQFTLNGFAHALTAPVSGWMSSGAVSAAGVAACWLGNGRNGFELSILFAF
jgi:hypothetical protein